MGDTEISKRKKRKLDLTLVDDLVRSLDKVKIESGHEEEWSPSAQSKVKVEKDPAACPTCGQNGEILKRCTGCYAVSYCSSNCQKRDWKNHKNDCCSFKITLDPTFGKQMVATRDLKPGTLILKEEPILFYTCWKGNDFVCLTCGFDFEGRQPRTCSTCHWPICCVECEQVPMHKENECTVFSSQKIEFSQFDNDHLNNSRPLLAYSIEFIRGLGLKKRNPKLYNDLLVEIYQPNDHYGVQYLEKDVKFLKRLICLDEMMDGQTVGNEELLRFRKSSSGNIFSFKDEDGTKAIISLVFLKSGRMSHSCTANCDGTVLPYPHHRNVRTTTGVLKGQPLTFNYFQVGFELSSRYERQLMIVKDWSFICKCTRCTEPDELGSFMDGVACSDCRPVDDTTLLKLAGEQDQDKNLGYLLPLAPPDLRPMAKWQCNRCKATTTFGTIKDRFRQLKDELETIKLTSRHEGRLERLEKFEKKCQLVFHPNHWILMEAAQGIIDMFNEKTEVGCCQHCSMTRAEYDKVLARRLYLAEIHKIIMPGRSQFRAEFLAEMAFNQMMTVLVNEEDYAGQEKLDLLTASISSCNEAAVFFDQDKDVTPSHKKVAKRIAAIKAHSEMMLR